VGLVQIDVVRLETAQGTVDRLQDVLAGQPAVILARAGRPIDLGEDLQALPTLPEECPPQHLLRARGGIDIRCIKRRDAFLQRRVNTCDRRLFLYLRTVGDPVSIGDLTDHQPAAAKMSIVHGASTITKPAGQYALEFFAYRPLAQGT